MKDKTENLDRMLVDAAAQLVSIIAIDLTVMAESIRRGGPDAMITNECTGGLIDEFVVRAERLQCAADVRGMARSSGALLELTDDLVNLGNHVRDLRSARPGRLSPADRRARVLELITALVDGCTRGRYL